MPSKIAPLHAHLAALRRERWVLRVIHGGLALGLLLLLAIATDFLLDWFFVFSRSQRAFALAVLACLAAWGLRRFIWPAMAKYESAVDLALLVERQQGIDSDLVAALQFETADARTWGSAQLEEAVVDYVAEFGNGLKVSRGLAGARLGRTSAAFVSTAVVLIAAALAYPNYAAVFINRLLLGAVHYPTDTTISRLSINDQDVDLQHPTTNVPRVPFGLSVRFAADASGVCPETGSIRIVAENGTGATTLALARVESAPAREKSAADNSPGVAVVPETATYTAELPKLSEAVLYQVYLGDAWTEPAPIHVIAPPVVALELDHTPPAYAARAVSGQASASSRQLSVIEGSQVVLTVRCGNKALASVEFVTGTARYALEPEDAEKRNWKLNVADTPLERVIAPVPFDVEVVDEDGLSPEQPLRGHIRIEADRPPRIAAAVVTEKVLPAARPRIVWGAADDYGLAEVRVLKQITRLTGEMEQSVDIVQQVPAGRQPPTTLRGRHLMDLAPLALSKGDQVRVTLEAVDFRGDHPGLSSQSEPLLFQVTDESGIFAGLIESDEKSARQLDQIIERQLGIGESR
jgi:hypothetical protein